MEARESTRRDMRVKLKTGLSLVQNRLLICDNPALGTNLQQNGVALFPQAPAFGARSTLGARALQNSICLNAKT